MLASWLSASISIAARSGIAGYALKLNAIIYEPGFEKITPALQDGSIDTAETQEREMTWTI
jgi:hypothetical protein